MKNLLFLLSILLIFSSCGYNKIVELEEEVKESWGRVESVYQRRADLIPQIMGQAKSVGNITAKYASKLEETKKRAVIELSSEDLENSDKLLEYQEAQSELGKVLSNFFSDLQQQPDFELYQQNILDLKAQIEGTENRINFERKKYNETVSEYNAYIRKVPQNLSAGVMGFDEKAYFEADKKK